MTPEEFLARLDGVRETSHPKWKWAARCPAHEDRDPSLSVGRGDTGKILLHCFAGCTEEAIVAALGVAPSDLLSNPPLSADCTLEALSADRKLPLDHLRTFGLSQLYYQDHPAVRIPFLDAEGVEKAILFRTALAGENRLKWKSGLKATFLYGVNRMEAARAAGFVVLVEGASDCWTLWFHNFPAVGLPSASVWREQDWLPSFEGIARIFAVIEPDQGGTQVKTHLASSALRDRVLLVTLDGAKDASELHCQDPERFKERFRAALDAATPWQQIEEAAAKAEADEAWQRCGSLAMEPDILSRIAHDLRRHGIAGEERFGQLVYLATISRFQARPVSIAAKGPSAAGKSFVMQKVLEFFPGRAYYALSAMSERALAYSKEPMQHRMMIVYEAQGLEGEWASYLMRSLLSEGRIRYETVVKGEGGPEPKLIEREGPTGLLTTTTKIFLHPENETRLLSVPADDSPEQTKRVLRQLARAVATPGVDFGPWHALQTWLAGSEHRVSIPYAETLAELVPPVAVRLRRDFGMLLSFICAHATLHQATRGKDPHGQIRATLTDYAAVRDLLADLLAEGVEAAVPPIVKETVQVVAALTAGAAGRTATVKQVAKALGIDTPPALRRVRMALERGYLKNESPERKKGQAYTLVLGDSLPEDLVILPAADDPRLAEFAEAPDATADERVDAPPREAASSESAQDADVWPEAFTVERDPVGDEAPSEPEPAVLDALAAGGVGAAVERGGNGNHKGDRAPDSEWWATLQPPEHNTLGWDAKAPLRRVRPNR